VVWHPSLQLMKSLNITEAVIFPMQALIRVNFPFSQIYLSMSLSLTIYIEKHVSALDDERLSGKA